MFKYLWMIILVVTAIGFTCYLISAVRECVSWVNYKYATKKAPFKLYVNEFVKDHGFLTALIIYGGAIVAATLFIVSLLVYFDWGLIWLW